MWTTWIYAAGPAVLLQSGPFRGHFFGGVVVQTRRLDAEAFPFFGMVGSHSPIIR